MITICLPGHNFKKGDLIVMEDTNFNEVRRYLAVKRVLSNDKLILRKRNPLERLWSHTKESFLFLFEAIHR